MQAPPDVEFEGVFFAMSRLRTRERPKATAVPGALEVLRPKLPYYLSLTKYGLLPIMWNGQ